jgi:toxin ParE1/3/4
MIIRFSSDPDAELAEARQWYAHQRQDLDLEFMGSVDEALTRVVRNPHLYPIVHRNLRRAVVRRFPFAIFFDVSEDEIPGHCRFPFPSRSGSLAVACRVARQ